MNEDIVKKIESLQVPDNQVEEFYEVLSGEVLQQIFEDYADKSTDEELEIMQKRLQESKSTDHLQTILNELAITVYGDSATDRISQIYDEKIEETKNQIEEARNLLLSAQAGDPEAIRVIGEAQQTDEYKQIISEE